MGLEENRNPCQELDEDEFCESIVVTLGDLRSELEKRARVDGDVIYNGIWLLAEGLLLSARPYEEQRVSNSIADSSKRATIEMARAATVARQLALPEGSGRILRVGLVCFGMSGRIFHAPFLVTNPKYRLVAVFERSKNEAQEFLQLHGYAHAVDTVRSVEDLVAREDIDLVVICSPIELHFQHAFLALNAGKHALVEKAFCSSSSQAQELTDLARKRSLIVAPFQNRRFDSDFLTLRRLLHEENAFGDIVEYNGYFNRWKPQPVLSSWKDTVPQSGGNFLSLGSHMIDQAVSLFGLPARVWADIRCQRTNGVLDDAWEVHLFYPSKDSVGNSCVSSVHKGGFRAVLKGNMLIRDNSIRYMVHGTRGSWIKRGLDNQEDMLKVGYMPDYNEVARVCNSTEASKGSASCKCCDERVFGSEPTKYWGLFTDSDGKTASTHPEIGSYHLLYDSLYETIVNKSPLFIDEKVTVGVIKLIELAQESSQTGMVMSFE